jgi:putative transposase
VQKLTSKDIERIIKQWKRKRPIKKIAEYFGVSRQRIHTLIRYYKQTGTIPFLQPSGRKTIRISDEEISLILESYALFSLGPVLLEKKIEIDHGIHIPHNTIYRVLLCHGLIEVNLRKRQQRKWVRYERKHSMSLWQGDWKEFEYDGTKKWVIAFMDDSSRLITCYGVFDTPTTENTLSVLLQGFAEYGVPREILTDHGTQFVSARDRENAQHTFKAFLELNGIKHIVARIKHPQTNGKIERFFGEVERRIGKFGSVDRIVKWQNEIKPHMSLNYQIPAKVFWYRLPPERILGFVKEWFYV